MGWLDWLERRFGDWSIPQFPLFIVAANGTIYLLSLLQPGFFYRLTLDPAAIHAGEWWRVFTFLFVPPNMQPFLVIFWLYLLYVYAQALETEWGEFKFCLFYLLGAAATVAAALGIVHTTLSNVPLNTTLFLAFATLYPEFELLLFFILPVKVKYLAWLVWLGMLWSLVMGSFVTRVAIAASLVNYLIFFGPQLWEGALRKVDVYRNRRRFRTPPES